MNKLIFGLVFVFLIVIPSYAIADPSTYLNIPPTNAFDKIRTDVGSVSAVNFSMPLKITGGTGVTVSANNSTHTVTITSTTSPSTNKGTYNQTQANNISINTGGNQLNFINGSGAIVSVQNSHSGNQVNVTISATGTSSGVSSLNALSGALTISCVAGNTTCTTSGGNTITINTAYNIATLNLNEIFSGITTMNNLKLGGQMNINGNTMQSFGHVYSWPNETGIVCLTNQTGTCGTSVVITRQFSYSLHGSSLTTTSYGTVNDIDNLAASESNADSKIGYSGILQRVSAHVTGNTHASGVTLCFRINGICHGSLIIGSSTGYFETFPAFSLSAQDRIDFQINGTNTGTLTVRNLMAEIQ